MIRTVDLPAPLDSLLLGMEMEGQKRGRPWVTLSYAQSLDGSIAVRRGTPLALSSPPTLKITHHLRARHEAILIGIGTLLSDDPQLNVRLIPGDDPQPVVLDNYLRTPLSARLLQNQKPPWIMTTQQASAEQEAALVQTGARVFRFATEWVDISDVLAVLSRENIHSVMVEGGARVITSFLQARLTDLIVLTLTPRFVGGLRGLESSLTDEGFFLGEFDVQRFGDDLLVWGSPRWHGKQ